MNYPQMQQYLFCPFEVFSLPRNFSYIYFLENLKEMNEKAQTMILEVEERVKRAFMQVTRGDDALGMGIR